MSVFSKTDALKPKRSFFKGLSHSRTFTCDMGQIIPILFLECYPGDVFKLGSECVVRFMPMVAPILHEVNVLENYFFVPYRLLSNEDFDWETYITGGKNGDGKDANGVLQVLPRWDVSSGKHGIGSLWDYCCFPLTKPEASCLPYDFVRSSYNLIYNQYFRDETLMSEVALTNEDILYRCWKKDYFTSALTSQQRGQAPALPGDIMYLGADGQYHSSYVYSLYNNGPKPMAVLSSGTAVSALVDGNKQPYNAVLGEISDNGGISPDSGKAKLVYTGADVSDMRLSFQVQLWMERNNRGGYRYTEVIRSHFGTAPADERMQRAEYIGGVMAPLIVREVLQTSQTVKSDQSLNPSVQGNMAGHGISASANYIGKYRVKEHGCIVGVMSIMPKPMYMSQGVDRQYLRRSRFDFYWPEFAHLSEQAIENVEIYAQGTSDDYGVFGFQGRFNELRWQGDKVCGLMRTDALNGGFSFWHLGRSFANLPALNADFVRADQIRKDFLAVPGQPACVVSYGNVVHAVRPIPKMPIPGRIDHS